MPEKIPLLTSRQVARFVADGFLRFDAVAPSELNATADQEMLSGKMVGVVYCDGHKSITSVIPEESAYGRIIRLPILQGVIASLIGPDPAVDHLAVHTIAAQTNEAQFLHPDSCNDPRTKAFDIQIFYFPHDLPANAGGTLFLPGSHLRCVDGPSVSRYQNVRGQEAVVCKAGTVIIAHHGLWHAGQPNRSQRVRCMVKLRLNPRVPQRRLWDMGDVDDPEIMDILQRYHPWHGPEHTAEVIQRLRLWRVMTGNAAADAKRCLTRMEHDWSGDLQTMAMAG